MINADHASRIILAPLSMSMKSTLEYKLNKELKYSKKKKKLVQQTLRSIGRNIGTQTSFSAMEFLLYRYVVLDPTNSKIIMWFTLLELPS